MNGITFLELTNLWKEPVRGLDAHLTIKEAIPFHEAVSSALGGLKGLTALIDGAKDSIFSELGKEEKAFQELIEFGKKIDVLKELKQNLDDTLGVFTSAVVNKEIVNYRALRKEDITRVQNEKAKDLGIKWEHVCSYRYDYCELLGQKENLEIWQQKFVVGLKKVDTSFQALKDKHTYPASSLGMNFFNFWSSKDMELAKDPLNKIHEKIIIAAELIKKLKSISSEEELQPLLDDFAEKLSGKKFEQVILLESLPADELDNQNLESS